MVRMKEKEERVKGRRQLLKGTGDMKRREMPKRKRQRERLSLQKLGDLQGIDLGSWAKVSLGLCRVTYSAQLEVSHPHCSKACLPDQFLGLSVMGTAAWETGQDPLKEESKMKFPKGPLSIRASPAWSQWILDALPSNLQARKDPNWNQFSYPNP
jgi:hypothetical protein